MLLQNTLDLSTFEIVRFRIWNQTSHPDDKGVGTKYFNTNSGHEGYNRENIYTATGWRMSAYMDDIDRINEKLDLILGEEIDTDSIIDSWKEVQDFLAGIEDTESLVDMLNSKLSTSGGTISNTHPYLLHINNTSGGDALIQFNNEAGGIGFSSVDSSIRFFRNGGGYPAIRLISDKSAPIFRFDGKDYDLLHSGNVGGYKAGGLLQKSVADLNSVEFGTFFRSSREALNLPTNTSRYFTGICLAIDDNPLYRVVFGLDYNGKMFSRAENNGVWSDWKTIAFTDSTVAAAKRLVDSNSSAVVHIGESGFYVGDNTYKTLSTSLMGNSILFRTGVSAQTAMTITDAGRVVVGTNRSVDGDRLYSRGRVNILSLCDNPTLGNMPENGLVMTDNQSTLGLAQWVSNGTGQGNIQVGRFDGTATATPLNLNPLGGAVNVGSVNSNTNVKGSLNVDKHINVELTATFNNGIELIHATPYIDFHFDNSSDDYTYRIMERESGVLSFSGGLKVEGLATFNGGALIPTGQTLTIGSVTFRETAAGEVEVDGNLHTTGTLASGGKGEAGTGSTGNAQVYQYELASGQSSYSVQNVKNNTNVIVQVYEWNSTTSSWDMILTDVNVKASGITVTFGRATTVNHLVTVC